jgi:hypothetical protein
MADWALASTLPAFTASASSSPPPPSSTTGLLVKLPLDEPPPPVQFEGKRFCFVGKFAFGSLKKCEATVMALGGSTQTFPSSNTDFVVIGTVGCGVLRLSGNWAKVEKALALKSEGSRCAIVTENHWVNSLKAKSQRTEGSTAFAAFPPIDQNPRQSPQSAANPHQIGVFPLELRDLSLPLDVYAAPTAFEVASSSGEGSYQVDLKAYTCTCPDFAKRRSVFSAGDARRACKHICTAMVRNALIAKCDRLASWPSFTLFSRLCWLHRKPVVSESCQSHTFASYWVDGFKHGAKLRR